MNKKWLLGLTVALLPIGLYGCSDTGGTGMKQTAETGKTNPKGPVTLKIMLQGDRPINIDEVVAEAEKRMAEKNKNIKLNLSFVPVLDLPQKASVMLAAGEELDLIWDAPNRGMLERISSGYYEPLESLLEKNGPNILKKRPKEMWEANKFNGKVYGIPLGVSHYQGKGVYIRQDIREKLGIPPVKTYSDFIKFLYAVKEKEKNIIPFSPDRKIGVHHVFNLDYETNIRPLSYLQDNFVLYFKNNDGIVHNLFEEPDPKIIAAFKEYRKYFEDGIINPDIMSVKINLQTFTSGKSAAITLNDFGVKPDHQAELQKNVPGAKAEYVTFMDPNQKPISNFSQWNFISVPVSSKHKEEAIQFLNWANEKDNYDLLAYGIKGKDWEAVGEDMYKATGKYRWYPYAWIWNPVDELLNANFSKEDNDMYRWSMKAQNFIPDKIVGFNFDTNPVANEVAQFNSLSGEYMIPFYVGALEFDKNFEAFKQKATPAAKKIQIEMQKQIDAFLKTKK
jgi:putative aldouronate transport system substrate-binding protein